MAEDYRIERNDAAGRFEVRVDGELCVLEYRLDDGTMIIDHTGVPSAVEGRGIAGALTRTAFDYARSAGLRVLPACTYAEAFVRRHPEYADLVSAP